MVDAVESPARQERLIVSAVTKGGLALQTQARDWLAQQIVVDLTFIRREFARNPDLVHRFAVREIRKYHPDSDTYQLLSEVRDAAFHRFLVSLQVVDAVGSPPRQERLMFSALARGGLALQAQARDWLAQYGLSPHAVVSNHAAAPR